MMDSFSLEETEVVLMLSILKAKQSHSLILVP